MHVKVDDKKLVLGILNAGNNPQLAFDLVFDTDFEISHNWKNGSVHLLGYQSEMPEYPFYIFVAYFFVHTIHLGILLCAK